MRLSRVLPLSFWTHNYRRYLFLGRKSSRPTSALTSHHLSMIDLSSMLVHPFDELLLRTSVLALPLRVGIFSHRLIDDCRSGLVTSGILLGLQGAALALLGLARSSIGSIGDEAIVLDFP